MRLAEWIELLRWRDLLDILLVALIVYNLLLLIRGTRALQVLFGILFLAGVYYLAGTFELATLEALLQSFLIILPFAVIVLFQQEIRRVLARIGRRPLLGLASRQEAETTVTEIVLAATALGKRRIGALIVIQRIEGLRNYIENGIQLDARVSYDLLMSIFTHESPLHDGAVIVQEDRIAAAACFLPLTLNPELSKELGTRHRAAIGIGEETDALAVVASEETGKVSVALGGSMVRDLDGKALQNLLYRHLISETGEEAGGSA